MAKYKGHGVMWDGENNKALCRFDKNGELVTQDERVKAKLSELGYYAECFEDELVIIEDEEEKKETSKKKKRTKKED